MSDKLNLTLPARKEPMAAGMKAALLLLACAVLLCAANLAVSLMGPRPDSNAGSGGDLAPGAQKALALKLQKQGLDTRAAAAWEAYLAAAALDDAERANIWYQIGKLRQEAGEHAAALEGYYRSESLHKDEALASEIGQRTGQCLESLGKFAALRYELAERVGIGADDEATGEMVVAEIGAQKITQAELDRRIEAEIERQLEQFGAHLSDAQRKAQKEQALKQLSTPDGRLQLLSQLVAEEVFYRRARESKLAEASGVQALIRDMERRILAEQVLRRELASKINITPSDVETYYQANKAQYLRPERARIAHILLPDAAAAQSALERLSQGESFEALAKELSLDEAAKVAGGVIGAWVERGRGLPVMGLAGEALEKLFALEAGQTLDAPIQSEQGFHVVMLSEREAAHQSSLEEVREEARRALRSRKEGEVQMQLLEELKTEYGVVIHYGRFGRGDPGAGAEAGNAGI